jgi:hypothetical protein
MREHGFPHHTFDYPQSDAGPEVRKYAERNYCARRGPLPMDLKRSPARSLHHPGVGVESSENHLSELEGEVDKAIPEG